MLELIQMLSLDIIARIFPLLILKILFMIHLILLLESELKKISVLLPPGF